VTTTPHGVSRLRTRHAWVAVLDTVLLLVYIALQEPGGATGFVLHEWIGLAFIPLFITHIVLSWRWIATTWDRVRSDRAPRARINFLLNAALFVMMTVVVVSGLVISEYALPAEGVATQDTQRWEQLHNFTSSLITPVVALHLTLNWSWIKRTVRRYVAPLAKRQVTEREDVA
jgi:cytochrome b561